MADANTDLTAEFAMSTADDRDIYWRRDGAISFWSGPQRAGGYRTLCHGVAKGDRSELIVAAKRWRERGILPIDVERDGICELTSLGFRGGLGPALTLPLSDGSVITVVGLVDGEPDRPVDLDAPARAVHLSDPRRFDSQVREIEDLLSEVIVAVREWHRQHVFES